MSLKELNDAYLDKVGYLLKMRYLAKYDESLEKEVSRTVIELEEIVDEIKSELRNMDECD